MALRGLLRRKAKDEQPVESEEETTEEGFPEAPRSFEAVKEEELEGLRPAPPEEEDEAEEENGLEESRKKLEEAERDKEAEKLKTKTAEARAERRKIRRERRFAPVKEAGKKIEKAEKSAEKGLRRVERIGTGLAAAHGISASPPRKRKTSRRGKSRSQTQIQSAPANFSQSSRVQPQFLPRTPQMLLPARTNNRPQPQSKLTLLPEEMTLNAAKPMGPNIKPRQGISIGLPRVKSPLMKKNKKGFKGLKI